MNPKTHHQRGFTLIEMMTVIIIILILASLTVAGVGFVQTKQANAKAESDIKMLSTALEKYRSDHGDYPGLDVDSPAHGDISEQLYNALFYDGYEALEANGGDGKIPIYLNQLDPRSARQSWVESTNTNTPPEDLKIIDPWGNPYLYRKGTNAHNPDFDLWSKGKDGITDTASSDKHAEGNRDDIRNF